MSARKLIHLVASNTWSGTERYALDLCTEFARRGWDVTAYTRDAKAVDSRFAAADIPLRHCPLRGWFDPSTIGILVRDLRKDPHGTIIHTHRYRDAFAALVARKLARRPDIHVINTRHIVRQAVNTRLYRRVYRNLDAQIFVSRAARDRFLSAWPGGDIPFPAERMHVVHNSINTDPPEPVPEPQKGPLIAIYHGRLAPGKGLEVLIDALPRLRGKRTRLWLVGGGNPDYVDRLRRHARMRGVMDLIDWKKHVDDPMPLIRAAHFGVLPSVTSEAFGLANIEYMAAGRPQICTDNGAQPEYLTSQEAILVGPGDSQALGDALLRLASDPQLRADMGAKAYAAFIFRLSWDRFSEKMERIYSLVSSR